MSFKLQLEGKTNKISSINIPSKTYTTNPVMNNYNTPSNNNMIKNMNINNTSPMNIVNKNSGYILNYNNSEKHKNLDVKNLENNTSYKNNIRLINPTNGIIYDMFPKNEIGNYLSNDKSRNDSKIIRHEQNNGIPIQNMELIDNKANAERIMDTKLAENPHPAKRLIKQKYNSNSMTLNKKEASMLLQSHGELNSNPNLKNQLNLNISNNTGAIDKLYEYNEHNTPNSFSMMSINNSLNSVYNLISGGLNLNKKNLISSQPLSKSREHSYVNNSKILNEIENQNGISNSNLQKELSISKVNLQRKLSMKENQEIYQNENRPQNLKAISSTIHPKRSEISNHNNHRPNENASSSCSNLIEALKSQIIQIKEKNVQNTEISHNIRNYSNERNAIFNPNLQRIKDNYIFTQDKIEKYSHHNDKHNLNQQDINHNINKTNPELTNNKHPNEAKMIVKENLQGDVISNKISDKKESSGQNNIQIINEEKEKLTHNLDSNFDLYCKNQKNSPMNLNNYLDYEKIHSNTVAESESQLEKIFNLKDKEKEVNINYINVVNTNLNFDKYKSLYDIPNAEGKSKIMRVISQYKDKHKDLEKENSEKAKINSTKSNKVNEMINANSQDSTEIQKQNPNKSQETKGVSSHFSNSKHVSDEYFFKDERFLKLNSEIETLKKENFEIKIENANLKIAADILKNYIKYQEVTLVYNTIIHI